MSRRTFVDCVPGCLLACLGEPVLAIEFDAGLLKQGSSLDVRRFEKAVVPEGASPWILCSTSSGKVGCLSC